MSDALIAAQEVVNHLLGSGSFISIGEAIAKGFAEETARQKAAAASVAANPPAEQEAAGFFCAEWARERDGVRIVISKYTPDSSSFFWNVVSAPQVDGEPHYGRADTFAQALAAAEAFVAKMLPTPAMPPNDAADAKLIAASLELADALLDAARREHESHAGRRDFAGCMDQHCRSNEFLLKKAGAL